VEAGRGSRRRQQPHFEVSALGRGSRPWPPLGGVLSDDAKIGPKGGRLATLRTFAEQRPQDPFPHYALALELKGAGLAEDAWNVLQALIARHPDYIPSYAPAGELLTQLGRLDEARAVYGQGVQACARGNDAHTRGNLEAALEALDG
jgi:tetratricopeptide (TPR) repeat protein